MYYQNGNYMQDLNCYNQTPGMGYQPYANTNFSNQTMPMNNNPIPMMQANLNTMYPATYRIISPVITQVLSNHNAGYLTEDALNSMVDTVYNIVEGDINLGADRNHTNNSTNENSNASNCERNSSTPRQNVNSTTTSRPDSQNALLRDLIKIMILNELNCRRQSNFNPMSMQNPNMTGAMFQSYNF